MKLVRLGNEGWCPRMGEICLDQSYHRSIVLRECVEHLLHIRMFRYSVSTDLGKIGLHNSRTLFSEGFGLQFLDEHVIFIQERCDRLQLTSQYGCTGRIDGVMFVVPKGRDDRGRDEGEMMTG